MTVLSTPARFDQVIQQMGYSRLQFRQLLEQEMLIGQLRAGISGTGFVTDQQVQNFARLEMQTRDFATLTVPAQHEAIEVSDEQINEFYEAMPTVFVPQSRSSSNTSS